MGTREKLVGLVGLTRGAGGTAAPRVTLLGLGSWSARQRLT